MQLKDPPVPFPVTDEQVGKGGRPVPDGTLQPSDPSFTMSTTLEEVRRVGWEIENPVEDDLGETGI